jgi:hypothetical protein
MSTKEDGGPAFPVPGLQNDEAFNGMSLRDYFIAHAPAEPQPWFVPVMPSHPRRVDEPVEPGEWSGAEDDEMGEWWEGQIETKDLKSDRARAFALAYDVYNSASIEVEDWQRENAKQRYIQWPAAWADEMLKARKA